jgi:hypothetical protein
MDSVNAMAAYRPVVQACVRGGELLKQFKVITLAPTCFSSRRNHHQGAVLCLAKTTDIVFSVLVDMDTVKAMTAYRPVVQACVRGGEEEGTFLIVFISWNNKKCF